MPPPRCEELAAPAGPCKCRKKERKKKRTKSLHTPRWITTATSIHQQESTRTTESLHRFPQVETTSQSEGNHKQEQKKKKKKKEKTSRPDWLIDPLQYSSLWVAVRERVIGCCGSTRTSGERPATGASFAARGVRSEDGRSVYATREPDLIIRATSRLLTWYSSRIYHLVQTTKHVWRGFQRYILTINFFIRECLFSFSWLLWPVSIQFLMILES